MYLLYSCPVGFFPPFAYRVFLFTANNNTVFYSTKTILVQCILMRIMKLPQISGYAMNIAQPVYPASGKTYDITAAKIKHKKRHSQRVSSKRASGNRA